MKKKTIFIVFGVIIAIIIAYYLISPAFIVKETNEEAPVPIIEGESPNIIAQATLVPSAHEVEGRVLLIENEGQKILRFEDLDTINGPDLFIYLSSDLEAEDFVNLGEIKATKGNVNYEVPLDIDTNKYNKVLIWCRAFKVLFSYGELS